MAQHKDIPTYPDNGIIYKGDYLKGIPYDQYIYRMPIPTENVYDIRQFGAVPDTDYLSTEAFCAAALAAVKTKGTVVVTGGVYIVGSIALYSDTTLFIDYGSTLKASRDLSQYNDALLSVKDVHDVTIRGGGKIHGNGEFFVNLPRTEPRLTPLGYTKLPPQLLDPLGYPEDTIRFAYRERIRYADNRWNTEAPDINRPMYTVWVRGSHHIKIENILIEDSLDWTLDIDYSEYITVKDMVIDNNRHVSNADGIDVMSSQNVTVSHVFISTADDGLCVKAPLAQGHDGLNVKDASLTMGPSKHITFRDCTVCSVMNAFKIGTETYYDIEDISVEDCTFIMPDIYPGGVGGISIESADGASVRNIRIKDIRMNNIVCPVFICLNKRNKFGFANEEDAVQKKYGGTIENIKIENIKAENMEIPCLVTGWSDKSHTGRIRDISIKDFSATYLDNTEILDIKHPLYENIVDYPESNAFGDLPAYGFFFRHADEISLENLTINPRSSNTRGKIIFEDCNR
ncbi:glycosyl hydrolase family 28 protein [uncultured Sphaerochaeta sp.]|uniref:glycoside hydrolase family 28 protein n=1 Tax=uncultured Sphaerochaeta sp. TaxID=886478 RepID=UPI002A0A9766|nr:glycosyl hydrolase family 28 protein [uncultured Sphaerochaeta sp.]